MSQVLALADIKQQVAQVAPLYNVKKVLLFGSYARGNQTKKSDVDLLVEFPELTSYFDIFEMQDLLIDRLGKPVEVVPGPLSRDSIIEIDKEILLYEQKQKRRKNTRKSN